MTKIPLTCEIDEDSKSFNLEPAIVKLLGEDWRDKWELVRDDLKEVDFEKGEAYVEAVFMKRGIDEIKSNLRL